MSSRKIIRRLKKSAELQAVLERGQAEEPETPASAISGFTEEGQTITASSEDLTQSETASAAPKKKKEKSNFNSVVEETTLKNPVETSTLKNPVETTTSKKSVGKSTQKISVEGSTQKLSAAFSNRGRQVSEKRSVVELTPSKVDNSAQRSGSSPRTPRGVVQEVRNRLQLQSAANNSNSSSLHANSPRDAESEPEPLEEGEEDENVSQESQQADATCGDGDQSEDESSDSEGTVDTATLIAKELGSLAGESSDEEEELDPWKITPQEVADRCSGLENPQALGWNNKFLSTVVQTKVGPMTLIQWIANRRRAVKWTESKDKYQHTGENTYAPQLHITHNQGYVCNLLKDLSHAAFRKLQNDFTVADATNPGGVIFGELIPQDLQMPMQVDFRTYCAIHFPDEKNWLKSPNDSSWKDWQPATFFARALKVYVPPGQSQEAAVLNRLRKIFLKYSTKDDFRSVGEWLNKCHLLIRTYVEDGVNQDEIVDVMVRKFRSKGAGAQAMLQAMRNQKSRGKAKGSKFTSYVDFWERFGEERRIHAKALQIVTDYGSDGEKNPRTYDDSDMEAEGTSYEEARRKRRKNRRKEQKRKRDAELSAMREKAARKNRKGDRVGNTADDSSDDEQEQCDTCGRVNHDSSNCKLRHHPDANHATEAWADSVKGKAWAAKGKTCCDFNYLLSGKRWGPSSSGKKDKDRKNVKGGKRSELMYRFDHLYAFEHDVEYTLPCHVSLVDSTQSLNARMLIDTGALQSNYVSVKTAAWLQGLEVRKQLVDRREGAQESCSCDKSSSKNECVLCNSDSKKSINQNNSLLLDSSASAVVQSRAIYTTTSSSKARNRLKLNRTKTGKSVTALRRKHNIDRFLSLVSKRTKVCSGITGMCTDSPGEVSFILTFFDSAAQCEESIPVTAKVLDTPYDLILGRPDIIRHNILQRIGSHLYVKSNEHEPLRPWQASLKGSLMPRAQPNGEAGSSEVNTLYRKDDLLTPIDDDDG
jgi:hypothetical protein